MNSISFELSEILNEHNINAEIIGREKTPFSIWRKVQKKRISLEQITDIIGFRIILDKLMNVIKLLVYFIKNGIVYLVNLKIIFHHLKLIDINHYILQLLDQIKDQLKFKLEHMKCMNLLKEDCISLEI